MRRRRQPPRAEGEAMPYITTSDGTELYYTEQGDGRPIVLSHGWPLCSDAWQVELKVFADAGYRVIAHDRRGHGRSSKTYQGNDMATYAKDLAQLVDSLDLRDIVAFDDIRRDVLKDRSQFWKDLSEPFFGANREGANVSQGAKDDFWRQGMLVNLAAAYDCVKAFSETDQTADLEAIAVPILIAHGDDDQIVPIVAAADKSIKLVQRGTLKVYPGAPHGIYGAYQDALDKDILEFIEE